MKKLSIGSPAPQFTLPDQDARMHSLSDYVGSWVLIYFYPKDDTPGCTKEACALRDGFPFFEKVNAKVLGISKDSPKSHKKFAEKYELPFTLLSDEDTKVMQAYDAWGEKKFMGKTYMGTFRNSYLIAPDGTLAKIYAGVKPELHAKEVQNDLEVLIARK